MQQSLSRRQVYERNTNADYGLNFQTKLDERIDSRARRQLHPVRAQRRRRQRVRLDVRRPGSSTSRQPAGGVSHKPNTLSATWAAANPALVPSTDDQYFRDQRVQFWRAAMDHFEESKGEEYALRADLAYNFDDESFIRRSRAAYATPTATRKCATRLTTGVR
jgi:hypothetical protein